jgi:hypothetical protein
MNIRLGDKFDRKVLLNLGVYRYSCLILRGDHVISGGF